MRKKRRDVLVVGGGPVGLYAAIEAASAGLDVAVLEARPGVVDKACGEGLMPAAVEALARVGVGIARRRDFVGIRYLEGDRSVSGRFSGGPGHGVRRTFLHTALRARLADFGVPVFEHRVARVTQDDDGVDVDGHAARFVLAADGLRSMVRRSLALQDPPRHRSSRYGLRQHYRIAPWTDHVEVYWHELGEAYVTPVADDEVGVALLFDGRTHDDTRSFADSLALRFPRLADRLGAAAACSTLRGAGPFEQRSRKVSEGRVMLVGDAAGYLDPITGEGLRLGFLAAMAAVDCAARDRAADYDAEWRRIVRRYWWSTTALLALRRSPLRPAMLPVLGRFPGLFDRILDSLGESEVPQARPAAAWPGLAGEGRPLSQAAGR